MLATLTINSLSDGPINTNDGILTLRDAVEYVSGLQPGPNDIESNGVVHIDLTEAFGVNDRIIFDDALFDSNGQATINLSEMANSESSLLIQHTVDELEMDGGVTTAGENRNVTLAGDFGVGRILDVGIAGSATGVTLKNLTVTGGHAAGGSHLGEHGGGIRATGNLTMVNVSARDNVAEDQGGGVFVGFAGDNQLIIEGGTFTGNSARVGGGLHLEKDPDTSGPSPDLLISINEAIVSNNSAEVWGGGIFLASSASSTNEGHFAVRNTTIHSNDVDGDPQDFGSMAGGGIYANVRGAALLIDGASIQGNSVSREFPGPPSVNSTRGGYGGGLYVASDDFFTSQIASAHHNVEIVNSTIARNQAMIGGGIHFDDHSWYFSTIRHSTIVENRAGPNSDSLPTESFGGGIAIEYLDVDFGQVEYDNPVFLDHTIVTGNSHDLNPDEPRASHLTDLEPDEVRGHQWSPNIGYAGTVHGTGEAQGYIDASPNNPNDNTLVPPPGAPFETMVTQYSHIGAGGVAPFNEIIELDEQNEIGVGGLIELPSPGREALAFLPVGAFVDAGASAFTLSDPPDYKLVNLAARLGLSDIEFDQRDDPFVRVYDFTQDPLNDNFIDIGAIERQPDPANPDPDEAPTVTNVLLSGSSWTGLAPISMAERLAFGEQYRALAQEAVNTISIRFSEPVEVNNSTVAIGPELTLAQTTRDSQGVAVNTTLDSSDFTFLDLDPVTNTATWQFHSSLPDGKFAIHLTTNVTDADGNPLDGDWSNPHNGTPDDYTDDPAEPRFQSGDGMAGSANNEFRFHFAILAGDFDGDGEIDGADQLLWQQANGTNDRLADGNGDGIVDGDDLAIWQSQFNVDSILPLRAQGGDFVDNEWVDPADGIRWQEGFGTEFDGSGFIAWQRAYGDVSAWYTGEESLGFTVTTAGTVGLAPQVTNVIISGSVSLHDPYSFDSVDGDGGQLVTVPVGGADTISIVFSEGVNVSAEHLIIIGLVTGDAPTIAEFAYDAAANTAVWRLENNPEGDIYLLSLSDAVTDVDGNFLDGEWVNPISTTSTDASISTFPSGDGNSGGRFNFVATLLPGDGTMDNIVNNDDYNHFWQNAWTSSGADFEDADFDGDGDVDLDDLYAFSPNWEINLQSVWILPDFDSDFDVDDDDLGVISANFGMTGATWADGDLNGDGEVGLEDLDLAFALYGLELDAA